MMSNSAPLPFCPVGVPIQNMDQVDCDVIGIEEHKWAPAGCAEKLVMGVVLIIPTVPKQVVPTMAVTSKWAPAGVLRSW